MSDDPVYEAVQRYQSLGWATVPVNYQSKVPVSKNWQQPMSKDAALRVFKQSKRNVGILLGVYSNWLIDIDLDCAEALSLAPTFLPPTPVVFGRYSNPASHWLYTVTGPLDTKRFKDPQRSADSATIVEIRSTGHQTVFPPSIHESGEDITFNSGIDLLVSPPPALAPDVLYKSTARLAAAVIVARHWPTGARHEASMALAGMLSRCGLTDEETLTFIEAIVKHTDDDEPADRLRAAKDTLKKLHSGKKKVSGAPALAEIIGEPAVDAIRNFLVDGDDADVIKRVNDEFKFLYMGSGVAIAHIVEEPDAKRKRIDFLSVSSFKERIADRYITVGKGDAIKTMKLANYWLNTPNTHPTYTRMSFSPSGSLPPYVFNTWRGFSVDPKEGDWSCYEDHMFHNVCQGSKEYFDWIMAFFADALQNPTVKPPASLVIRGQQGTGKTVAAEVVASLVTEHSSYIYSPHQLVGKFNGHMQDCLFLIANEAFFAGDKQHESVLKSLITDKHLVIERKGKDMITVPNYLRLVMTSNEDWVIPAAFDDRRFAVFEIGTRNQKDHSYFAALHKQMDSGGREALLHHLLNLNYDKSFAHNIPRTKAFVQQRELSRSPVEGWWEERLMQGHPCPAIGDWSRRGASDVNTWPEYVAKEALFSDFRSSNSTYRYKYDAPFWVEFWSFLSAETKTAHRPLHTVHVPRRNVTTGEEVLSKERLFFIKLPPLAEARAMFSKLRRREVEWPDLVNDPKEKEEY